MVYIFYCYALLVLLRNQSVTFRMESNVGEPKSKLETMTSWLKLSPIGGYVSTVLGISSYLKKN